MFRIPVSSLLFVLCFLTGREDSTFLNHYSVPVTTINDSQRPGDSLPAFIITRLLEDSTLLVARCLYKQQSWYALHQYGGKPISSSSPVTIYYYDSTGNLAATYRSNGGFATAPHMVPAPVSKTDIGYHIPDTVRALAKQAGINQVEICNYQKKILYLLRKADYRNTSRLSPLYTDSYYTEQGKIIASFQYRAQWNLPRKNREYYPTVCTVDLHQDTHIH